MDLQASDNDIEHGGEGIAAIGDVFVDHDTRVPDEQGPREEEDEMQGAKSQAFGETGFPAIFVSV